MPWRDGRVTSLDGFPRHADTPVAPPLSDHPVLTPTVLQACLSPRRDDRVTSGDGLSQRETTPAEPSASDLDDSDSDLLDVACLDDLLGSELDTPDGVASSSSRHKLRLGGASYHESG